MQDNIYSLLEKLPLRNVINKISFISQFYENVLLLSHFIFALFTLYYFTDALLSIDFFLEPEFRVCKYGYFVHIH